MASHDRSVSNRAWQPQLENAAWVAASDTAGSAPGEDRPLDRSSLRDGPSLGSIVSRVIPHAAVSTTRRDRLEGAGLLIQSSVLCRNDSCLIDAGKGRFGAAAGPMINRDQGYARSNTGRHASPDRSGNWMVVRECWPQSGTGLEAVAAGRAWRAPRVPGSPGAVFLGVERISRMAGLGVEWRSRVAREPDAVGLGSAMKHAAGSQGLVSWSGAEKAPIRATLGGLPAGLRAAHRHKGRCGRMDEIAFELGTLGCERSAWRRQSDHAEDTSASCKTGSRGGIRLAGSGR